MLQQTVTVYTDGSCHTQQLVGAWVTIIFIGKEKIILSAVEKNTTHNRMELTAIIKAMEFLKQQNIPISEIFIITDSQYAIGLEEREHKFQLASFTTKKGLEISNAAMVKNFLQLLKTLPIKFIKIRAHQKQITEDNYNIEADKLSRNLVRQAVKIRG